MQRRNRLDRIPPHIFRRIFNFWPCIRGTGVKVTYIAPDWSELQLKLPLSWRTRNYVGTIYGGSLYASVDPYYMLLLMHRLGLEYVVWDKAASIRFRRPATRTLTATIRVSDDELAEVKRIVDADGYTNRTYTVELVDAAGEPYCTVEKVVYVATRQSYEARQRATGR